MHKGEDNMIEGTGKKFVRARERKEIFNAIVDLASREINESKVTVDEYIASEFTKHDRSADKCLVRSLIWALAYSRGFSISEIGRFSERDRSTVNTGIWKWSGVYSFNEANRILFRKISEILDTAIGRGLKKRGSSL